VLTVPVESRYWEDYVPGTVHEVGALAVDQAEIIAFAQRYDPQPFHLDPEAARQSPYGGLIASGWHTAALAMRMLVDGFLPRAASLGSPGVDELRWLQPVRPGDTLSVRVEILEARRSRSKPEQGIVRTRVEVLNQTGTVVMRLTGTNFLRCRNPA
jgi:acyl dehydratase